MSSSKKRTASTASLDSPCWLLEDGPDDDNAAAAAAAEASGKPVRSSPSSCRRRLFKRSSPQERVLRDKKNDPKYLPIDALVDRMVGVRKDQDRAETKELCSKLLEIIQEMKRDDDDALPRSVTVGLGDSIAIVR
ncbi:hypothetical protein QTG54_008986 [Skeletonema marinoi]|uniref:Uncharacterized protein n=1 Tax=Skeletonema marinoi TaxID=267567 RepID=A0AAD9DAB4_9STRA|nr:hypothetical protein QTG54_008986 [Skeletonema marinoi]